MNNVFEYEDKSDWPRQEGNFKIIHWPDGINIMVRQEKIFFDRQKVSCYAFLPSEEMRRLRDWLNAMLDGDKNNE